MEVNHLIGLIEIILFFAGLKLEAVNLEFGEEPYVTFILFLGNHFLMSYLRIVESDQHARFVQRMLKLLVPLECLQVDLLVFYTIFLFPDFHHDNAVHFHPVLKLLFVLLRIGLDAFDDILGIDLKELACAE